MRGKVTLAAVAAAVAAAAPFAATAQDAKAEYERRNAERYVASFTALDRNGDGSVSRAEAQGDLNFVPHFDDIDINRDGVVTAPELERYLQLQHGVRVVLTPNSPAPTR